MGFLECLDSTLYLEEIQFAQARWQSADLANLTSFASRIPSCLWEGLTKVSVTACKVVVSDYGSSVEGIRQADCRAAQTPKDNAMGVALTSEISGEILQVRFKGVLDLDPGMVDDDMLFLGQDGALILYTSLPDASKPFHIGRQYYDAVDERSKLLVRIQLWGLPVDETSTYTSKIRYISNWLAYKWEGNLFRETEEFVRKDVPKNATSPAYMAGDSDFPEYVVPYAGSLVGLSARSNAAIVGGNCVIRAKVNGVASTLNLTLDSSNQQAHAVQAKSVETFVAGARIGAQIVASSGLSPDASLDIVISPWIFVQGA